MDHHATYDNNNIFARMIRGEMACYKVYEDDDVMAILDIMPRTEGHVLVLPKVPAMNLLDIPADALAKLMVATRKIARASLPALGAEGVQIVQRSFEAAGQEVFHFHMHIMPRYKDRKLKDRELATDEQLKAVREKLVAALAD